LAADCPAVELRKAAKASLLGARIVMFEALPKLVSRAGCEESKAAIVRGGYVMNREDEQARVLRVAF
jgi:hypothetical protein